VRTVQRTATAPPQADPANLTGVSVDDLADQVLRRIRDQLRVDRERRGSIADRRG
jgi:hypothetical protein